MGYLQYTVASSVIPERCGFRSALGSGLDQQGRRDAGRELHSREDGFGGSAAQSKHVAVDLGGLRP